MKNAAAVLVFCAASAFLNAQTTLNGAGSTFVYPIMSKWASEYHKTNQNVQVNYQSIGSGGGVRQVSEGVVDFGATDSPMTNEQLSAAKIKVMHIPTVLGAVVPVYNIPGINKDLNLSG